MFDIGKAVTQRHANPPEKIPLAHSLRSLEYAEITEKKLCVPCELCERSSLIKLKTNDFINKNNNLLSIDYLKKCNSLKKVLRLWPYMSKSSRIMVSKTWNPKSEMEGPYLSKPSIMIPVCHQAIIGWRPRFPLTFRGVKYKQQSAVFPNQIPSFNPKGKKD